MPLIHEANFENIGGYPIKESRQSIEGVERHEIPSARELVSGGETPKDQIYLANILPVMQEQGFVQPFNRHSRVFIEQRGVPKSHDERDTAPVRPEAPRRSRGSSGIQCYASHQQLYGVCNVIR